MKRPKTQLLNLTWKTVILISSVCLIFPAAVTAAAVNGSFVSSDGSAVQNQSSVFQLPIDIQLDNCTSLPCSFFTGSLYGVVSGQVTQTASQPNLVLIKTSVSINGIPQGGVDSGIIRHHNGVQVIGTVSVFPNNSMGLQPGNLFFDEIVTGGLPPGQSLPMITVKDAVAYSMWLTLIDLTGTTESLSAPPPQCEDQNMGKFGCSGPMNGFLLFPIPSSDAIEDCCIQHDACFRNGGDESCKDKCNQDLSECVNNSISIFSIVYTNITLELIGLISSGFQENTDKCRCDWDVTPERAAWIRNLDYDFSKVYHGKCCPPHQKPNECKPLDCGIFFGGSDPETGDPVQAGFFWGHCKPARTNCG